MLRAGHKREELLFLKRKPKVPKRLEWVVDAFWDLSSSRAIGLGGVGPIPFVAVDAWAERFGVRGDEFLMLKHLVFELDREYMAIEAERRKRETHG